MPRLIAGLVAAAALLLAACSGGSDDGANAGADSTATELPTASLVATPTTSPTPGPTGPQPLYLALGDSLSVGVGASNEPALGWVGLVSAALTEWDLSNLGVSGDDSRELLFGGPLDEGLRLIAQRATDAEEIDAGQLLGETAERTQGQIRAREDQPAAVGASRDQVDRDR